MNWDPKQLPESPSPHSIRRLQFRTIFEMSDREATGVLPSTIRSPIPTQSIGSRQNGDRQAASMYVSHTEQEQWVVAPIVLSPAVEQQRREIQRKTAIADWKPGTFGFDSVDDDPEFEDHVSLSTLVLRGISAQQDHSASTMQSEISGAAGAGAMVGIGNVAGTVLRYGSNLMIQRGFGAGPYGLYSLCMSLVTLTASIFTLGLDNAMIRFTAIYRSKKQGHSLIGLMIFCTALVGVTGIIGALLLMFLAPFIGAVKHNQYLVGLLVVMSPLVPLTCMQVIWFAGLQGFKAFKWRVIAQRLLPAVAMILLVGIVLLFFHKGNPDNLMLGIALATLVSTGFGVLLGLYFLFRQVSRVTIPGPQRYELREWLNFSTPNFLSSIVDTVLVSTDTIFLAFFAVPFVQIGYYTAALKISAFISLPLVSLNAMFTPIIAELHAKGEMQKLTSMFKLVTKWTITLSLPIFGVATLFSVPLLSISGESFVAAWPLLIALSLGNMVNAGTGSVGYMLLMTGHQKLSFLNSLVAVIFNVAFNIILTPRYGAMGTAIATGLAYTIVNLMRLLQVYVLLKIQPYRWDVFKPLAAGLISAGVTEALLYLLNFEHLFIRVGHENVSFQLFLVPVFLALYIVLIPLFKFSAEDKIVIDALRKKISRNKK